jgi:protein-disulfide isomerase
MRKWTLFVVLATCAACNKKSEAKPAAPQAPANPAASAENIDSTPPPGVDLTKLDESERKIFFRAANKASSACGKAQSLMASAKKDPSCKRSVFALRLAAKLADDGYLESEIVDLLDKRYSKKPEKLDVSDAPMKGDASAPVVVVEFADFECPHCKHLQPALDRLLEDYKGKVRVYFKHFPLRSHPNAEAAAVAAAAAQKQGKFWAMTAQIWQNQEALTPPDLDKYAQKAGLDVKKWKTQLADATTSQHVAKDRADGDKLNIQGTPAVYVNGREADVKDYDGLKALIEEELEAAK